MKQNHPKIGQLWAWCDRDYVYLVSKKGVDNNGLVRWEWMDLNKGVYFESTTLTIEHGTQWKLLVDTRDEVDHYDA